MDQGQRWVAARLRAEVQAGRLDPDPSQAAAADRLESLQRELLGAVRGGPRFGKRLRHWLGLPPSGQPRGLYLWGGVGRGKTLLVNWFHEGLDGGRALRLHFYQFMRRVHAELATARQRPDPLRLVAATLAQEVDVLCLDEFFVADIADAMILGGLLEALFARGVILVTTSNAPPEGLYPGGLQRARFLPAIDLLRARLDVVHLDGGADYRLRRLELAPTYFDATQPSAAAELARRFADLADDAASGPQVLQVEGRELRARARGPGMVWFDFAELCEGPRSQNDYIELARLYHTIFLSDVPRFDEYNENAAKRFIMLVDEFYDRGVKLLLSAAAPPADLYHGARSGFEFRRTESRLTEMQTRAYLARGHRV